MAKSVFLIRIEPDDIKHLHEKAREMGTTAAGLARIFIQNGLSGFNPELVKMNASIDSIASLSTKLNDMLLANLFLASRGQVMTMSQIVQKDEEAQELYKRKEGETQEAYTARLANESMRLITVAMGNKKVIQNKIGN